MLKILRIFFLKDQYIIKDMAEHKLIKNNYVKLLQSLQDESQHLIFCNIPVDEKFNLSDILHECHRVIKPGGSIYFYSEEEDARSVMKFLESSFGSENYCNQIVLRDKKVRNRDAFNNRYDFLFLYAKKKGENVFSSRSGDVWMTSYKDSVSRAIRACGGHTNGVLFVLYDHSGGSSKSRVNDISRWYSTKDVTLPKEETAAPDDGGDNVNARPAPSKVLVKSGRFAGAKIPARLTHVSELSEMIVKKINEQRSDMNKRIPHPEIPSAGEPGQMTELKNKEDIAAFAKDHSNDMAKNNFLTHYSSEGLNPPQRADKFGFDWRSLGYCLSENIVSPPLLKTFSFWSGKLEISWNTLEELADIAVRQWMLSSGHRANILNEKFVYGGVGCAVNLESMYVFVTQNFV